MTQILAGEYRVAQETIDTTLALFPTDPNYAYITLAILQEAIGNPVAAAETIQKVPVDSPEGPMVMGLRYAFIGLAGDPAAAREGLNALVIEKQSGFVPASQIGMAAIGCRDYAAAVHWLTEGAVVERDPVSIWYNVLPFMRHLHGDMGFRNLVEIKMRLEIL